MRKAYATTMSALNAESTNRLIRHCNREFKAHAKGDVNFDDRVRDVILRYALDPKSVKSENEYLDSIHYGCEEKPEHLLVALDRFSGPHQSSARWNKNYREAINLVKELTQPQVPLKVREINSSELFSDALSKKDASAGFDFILTGLKHKGEYIDMATEMYRDALTDALCEGTFGMPIITYHRLQVSGAYDKEGNRTPLDVKKKGRLVCAVAVRVIQHELSTSKQAQSHSGSQNWYASGKTPEELHRLVNTRRWRYKYWLSLDYSSYDQTIPGWLIRDAFDVVWSWFNPQDRVRHQEIWDTVVNDFVNKAFVGPEGKLVYAEDGVPSGSMYTQIIDTIVNLLMIHTYLISLNKKRVKQGLKPVKAECLICGDDNLIFSDYELDDADVFGYLGRMFGISGHPGKCDHGECKTSDPVFLSRVWRPHGAWRNPKELFAKMCYPERFRDYGRNPDLSPELIVYSYILAYPLGMRELIDVNRFMLDNKYRISDFSDSVLGYVGGYLAYERQYA